ncbi:uncharacterized protein ASPGLDRAFT_808011 [Aspergillus glaucus CBS 516.65]|uniref:Uncharacterized protein n=1 Tax=Aspergillus glaucus CBS 516.65 TaxID=1160497 RepID=A0A1L9VAR8_ASPGL|nr:hypothetical protein ASPGLDRAFT_808011 [Aspergillus glaucus CBS 516.65]OJJ80965.1 hypothetical protein ASPGLDRAFT_808011 [Aspergillus glaucus CBS 516.65]
MPDPALQTDFRSGFLQYMRDAVTADYWKAILTGIQGADDSIRNLLQTLSEKAVGEIDCKVDSISKKVDDSLALALDIKYGIIFKSQSPW